MKGWKFYKSIQWKLVIIYILLILFSMQIIGIYFIQSVERYFLDNFDDTLKAQASLLSVNLEQYLADNEKDEEQKRTEIDALVDNLFELNGVDVSIIDSSGIVLSTTEKITPSIVGQKISQTEVNRALLGTRDETVRVDAKTGQRMKYYAVPIKQGNNVLGAVYMKASIEGVYDTVNRINKILTTATLIALSFTALLGFILSRTITKPIKEITEQAARISKGDFDKGVRIYGDDEIGRLGETFNKMAKRLKDAISQNEEEREKLSSVLTHMSDGVVATNEDGKIIVVNQRAIELIGKEHNEINQKYLSQVFTNLIFPENGGSIFYHYEIENESKILKMNFSMIQSSNRGQVGTIIVLTDVTKEQQLEQMRKDFVADVSHELRTPLTTIKSYIEALEDGAIEEKELANRFIKVANNETDRMIRLVSDLLNLSRLDEKTTLLKKTSVSIQEMIDDVVDRFSFQCMQRGIDLTVEMSKYLPAIDVDRDQLDQVLDNLISNAIKYTKETGSIIVKVWLEQSNLFIEITDNGIGISKKHLSRIFERFYRVDKARSRELGGTGLGLSIAKEIIKAHNGEVYIESEPEKGTRVGFYIPISEGEVN